MPGSLLMRGARRLASIWYDAWLARACNGPRLHPVLVRSLQAVVVRGREGDPEDQQADCGPRQAPPFQQASCVDSQASPRPVGSLFSVRLGHSDEGLGFSMRSSFRGWR